MSNDFEASWQRLRATRWNPPRAAAASDERRRTYVAALEQAEQMMRAAGQVGPASSPLLLFYGLSQAGRAIAAAAIELTDEDWRLEGHGIAVFPRSALAEHDLADITLITDEADHSGSFARLSGLLSSPLWPRRGGGGPVRLETLWNCLPECWNRPLTRGTEHRRTPLGIEFIDQENTYPLLLPARIWLLPDWIQEAQDVRAALDEYLESFDLPQPAEIPYVLDDKATPRFIYSDKSGGNITANWMLREPLDTDTKSIYREGLTYPYNGQRYVFPAFGEHRLQMHPLMAWWGVLFALSMLARYEPDRWWGHIDVDHGPYAVMLEQLLADARTTLPHLVADTLVDVS